VNGGGGRVQQSARRSTDEVFSVDVNATKPQCSARPFIVVRHNSDLRDPFNFSAKVAYTYNTITDGEYRSDLAAQGKKSEGDPSASQLINLPFLVSNELGARSSGAQRVKV
jgi:hypothetical protein